jgi:hypothetical protein
MPVGICREEIVRGSEHEDTRRGRANNELSLNADTFDVPTAFE